MTYLGHSAFLFEERTGERLLIDPFGNARGRRWFSKRFPALSVDLVAVTHDHFDHNAVDALPANTPLMADESTRRVGGTTIRGVRDVHAGEAGRNGLENVIYVVEHEGVRYCHLGDNRHDIPADALAQIGNVDALMVAVDDSNHLMTGEEVDALVESLSPKIVIPMHYYAEGLTTEESTLAPPDGWMRRQARRRPLRRSTIRIDRRGMPYEREVWLARAQLAA